MTRRWFDYLANLGSLLAPMAEPEHGGRPDEAPSPRDSAGESERRSDALRGNRNAAADR